MPNTSSRGIGAEEAETLLSAWRLQSAFAQVTRLCLPEAYDDASASAVFKRRLAGLLDYPDFNVLVAELKAAQGAARAVFEKFVGKVRAG